MRADPYSSSISDWLAASYVPQKVRGRRLTDGAKAVVLFVLSVECPVSNRYAPEMARLSAEFGDKGVVFYGIHPDPDVTPDRAAKHAAEYKLPFPVLKDFGQKLADTLGVTRVPAVVVLDGDFVLRYRGRVDDRYGAASRRDKATRADLAQALDEGLAGKKLSVAETEVDGCLLDRSAKKAAKAGVTYAKDVARILQDRCQACHRPGQSAPFALMTYDDAAKHGRMIKEVTAQRRMPPWHADGRYGHFRNDRRLPAAEVATLTPTGLPPWERTSKAPESRVTALSKVTVRLLTIDRWAAPSLTTTLSTRAGPSVMRITSPVPTEMPRFVT